MCRTRQGATRREGGGSATSNPEHGDRRPDSAWAIYCKRAICNKACELGHLLGPLMAVAITEQPQRVPRVLVHLRADDRPGPRRRRHLARQPARVGGEHHVEVVLVE